MKSNHGWRTRDTGPYSYELRSPNGSRHHVELPPAREPLPGPRPSTDLSAFQQYDGWYRHDVEAANTW